ncbi:urea ABC transporter permease subunit UrtB [Colwellia sp. 1_MG-2023]|uniref:urea ABC transporter permease subunit UrtB n=1 Tax=unclassified Colwellia TaxID=196834 RepID=UPI001C0A2FA4|nr:MULTISPECIES: urea ABC transporter permease subunit UrtB [unclassified Colwellia]MBU2924448.1 urea ABC transporter permease subunit UrtB [Colwellia sp. C2M11]MDO6653108.1 urea ABC transporter permease subunit UrtB [Colwellia sp. 3_MG-2023]MDO6665905.1 urea ABC transporter permease subunit UrtB [Colwellia sp. 2_MG-2023]MDO6690278.1 urea ABC transporter permease subunit UrtB [Colwellia sp. 1_MG-2023]
MKRLFSVLLSCIISWQALANTQDMSTVESTHTDSTLSQLVNQLPTTKLNKMSPLLEKIAETRNDKTRGVLKAMMEGDLYYLKTDKTVVLALKEESLYSITNILTAEALAPVKKSKLRKVKTNNRLRGDIRSFIAKIDLTDPNKAVREQAVKQLLDNSSKSGLAAIQSLITTETDDEVRELMHVTLLLNQLKTGTHHEVMAAITQLEDTLEPSVNNTMVKMLAALPTNNKTPEQKALAASLTKVISSIEDKRSFFGIIENIFFGLSLGSVLLLAAIGLTITFGVMGVINMAHGEMMMLGAYTTYVIQLAFPNLIEYSLLMAVPAAFLVSGFVGIIIERGVIRYLKGRPLETLLATFGISLILQQLVRTIFSPLNRQVQAPEWMTGSWVINPVFSLTYNRLYIIIFSLMVFFTLLLILKKSSLGLHVRAVSQNRDMARALSIKSDRVDAITFGLGSGIAGVAGVVLSQLTNVGPNLGQAYIIDSFLVVVFGGVGNLWGTLVAAMSLGSINKFLEPVVGSVLANIIVLVGLVLFIQKRPKGLFPQKGRAAD